MSNHKESSENIRQKFKKLREIYDEFFQKIKILKKEQDKIIKDILKRVDREKVQKILKSLNNK